MEEIKLNMENLTKEEREQLLKLVEKANRNESKVWKPKYKDKYYLIDDCGEVIHSFWSGGPNFIPMNNNRYDLGNCFKTQEEAEFALERQKVIVELERYALKHNDPTKEPTWELGYNRKEKAIHSIEYIDNFVSSIRFTSSNLVDEAIETIGEDRLIKYYFGIQE